MQPITGWWKFKTLTEERNDLLEQPFAMCVPIVYMQWNIMGVEVRSLKCHIIDSDGNHHFPECWKIRSPLKNEFVAANALSGKIGTAPEAGDFQCNCLELFKELPIWGLRVGQWVRQTESTC